MFYIRYCSVSGHWHQVHSARAGLASILLPHPSASASCLLYVLYGDLLCSRFSENKADVVSVEIRIRKLEFNLSKQVAYEEKVRSSCVMFFLVKIGDAAASS